MNNNNSNNINTNNIAIVLIKSKTRGLSKLFSTFDYNIIIVIILFCSTYNNIQYADSLTRVNIKF